MNRGGSLSKLIKTLKNSMQHQVQNNASSVEKAVEAIGNTNLLQENIIEKEDEYLEFQVTLKSMK